MWALAIACTVAGCYRPDLDACRLACSANGGCPAGLSCNAQNLCAGSAGETCTDPPTDGASADAELTQISIDVVDANNAPLEGASVVFSTPAGEMLREVRTPTQGHVEVSDIPVGATVTIIRPAATGPNTFATTYTDLWPDAAIVSRFTDIGIGNTSVTVNVNQPSGTARIYDFYTTCGADPNRAILTTGDAFMTTLQFPGNCQRFDVIVVARNGSEVPVSLAFVGDLTGPSAITISTTDWTAIDASPFMVQVSGGPGGATRATFSGHASVAYASPREPIVTLPDLPASGASFVFPTRLGMVVALEHTLTLPPAVQRYVERLPPNTTTFMRDLQTRRLPWLSGLRTDAATRTLTWQTTMPVGVGAAPVTIASVAVDVRRGPGRHVWHVISRGDRISTSAGEGSFLLPDIPGDNPFEPRAGDVVAGNKITYLSTTPGVEDAVRGRIESHEATLDIFGIGGLGYVVTATAE